MAVFVAMLHANCWGFWMNESFKVTFIWCFQIFISIHLTSHSDVGFQQKHTNYKIVANIADKLQTNYKIVANIADKLQPHFQKSWGTYCKMQFTICDVLILPILTHKSTKKSFPMYSLTNIIVFCKYIQILILQTLQHTTKSWERGKIKVKR